jgi:hypothetical protein
MFKTIVILAAILPAALPARADEASFYGRWKIVGAVMAP